MDFAIELGIVAADKITGFQGVVTGCVEYLTGCKQYLIQPACKNTGELIQPSWFDEDRLIGGSGRRVNLARTTMGFDAEPPSR